MSALQTELVTDRWIITTGEVRLDVCPCCGLPFKTKKAAQAVIRAIDDGSIALQACLDAQRLWKAMP